MKLQATSSPQVYIALRERALGQSRPTSAPQVDAFGNVFGIIMEMGLSNATMTAIAFSDGTASIYLSNGSGFIGGGQSTAAIRKAAIQALKTAIEFAPMMQFTNEFPLPQQGSVSLYVRTDAGTRVAFCRENDLREGLDPFLPLANAMQNIITQYRLKYQRPAILQ